MIGRAHIAAYYAWHPPPATGELLHYYSSNPTVSSAHKSFYFSAIPDTLFRFSYRVISVKSFPARRDPGRIHDQYNTPDKKPVP